MKDSNGDTCSSDEGESDPVAWIDNKARQVASDITYRRIGWRVRPADICAPKRFDEPVCPAYDAYADAFERGWRAHLTYDPDRDNAGSWEAYVGFHIYTVLSPNFFAASCFVPKNAALDFLRCVDSSHEPVAQRQAWVDLGRDGLDFDTIHQLVNDPRGFNPKPTLGDGDDPGDTREEPDQHPDARCTEDAVDARLFLDQALDGIEYWVWWLNYYGIPQTEWSDHIPAEYLDGVTHLPSFLSRALKRARATVESWEYGS